MRVKASQIDARAAAFIRKSPFCVLATCGSDVSVDTSPRGGNPGFVRIVDPGHLLMPDRFGNDRTDSFKNIVAGGFVQLLFFVPGIDETLRVGGQCQILIEPELLASMKQSGKIPRAVLSVAVLECYFHCSQALRCSKLWNTK